MESIGRLVVYTGRAVGRGFSEALAQAGSSLPTWMVLQTLHEESSPTQQDLARAVGMQGPTLTERLDRLEAAGLVVRTRAPGDRRAVRVELTSQGEFLFHRLREAAAAFDDQLRAGISDEEARQLQNLLHRVRHNLDDAAAQGNTGHPTACS